MRPALLACLIALSTSTAAAPARAWHDGATSDRERPLVHALQTVGVKYRLGGRSPETGFDCSGLISHVFERAWGVLLPPGTAALSKVGRPVDDRECALDVIGICRAGPQEELAAAAAQRGARLEERLQRRQDLLDRAVPERNDFKGLLRVRGRAKGGEERGKD